MVFQEYRIINKNSTNFSRTMKKAFFIQEAGSQKKGTQIHLGIFKFIIHLTITTLKCVQCSLIKIKKL